MGLISAGIGAIGGVLTSMWSDHMVRSGRLTPLSARKVTLISTVVIAPLCIFVPFIHFDFHVLQLEYILLEN